MANCIYCGAETTDLNAICATCKKTHSEEVIHRCVVEPSRPVFLSGIDVPFADLVILYFKLLFAAVPALLIIGGLWLLVTKIFVGVN